MISREQISSVVRLLQEARRPIFIFGAGIRHYAKEALALARSLGIPIATTWGAVDLVNYDDPLMAGAFGTHGTRAANFAVQNSDLVISIGSRLDTKATAAPHTFARGSRVAMCDIDAAEIRKFEKLGRKIDVGICADAGEFIDAISRANVSRPQKDTIEWNAQMRLWRRRYDTPIVTWPGINPYELVKEIGRYTTAEDILASDTGNTLGWIMQGFPFKGERMLHAFNVTPMGYGLPSAVGASLATGKRVVVTSGDGSILMSLTELVTIEKWNLDIKVILFDNKSHSMCCATERQWFGGRHASTTIESGLSFPDWDKIPSAFRIRNCASMDELFSYVGPGLFRVEIEQDAHLIPQTRFGFPLEDGDPPLSRQELNQQMIVPTLEISNAG